MHKNRSQGFTLIELLVVIAIIGILSAVVLASLNTARDKGQDAAIKTQSQLFYDSNGGKYNTNGTTGIAVGTSCAVADTMFTEDTFVNAIAGIKTANGGTDPTCYMKDDGQEYSIWAKLRTGTSDYLCLDQNNLLKPETEAQGTNTACL